jgi:hypothetical protein
MQIESFATEGAAVMCAILASLGLCRSFLAADTAAAVAVAAADAVGAGAVASSGRSAVAACVCSARTASVALVGEQVALERDPASLPGLACLA